MEKPRYLVAAEEEAKRLGLPAEQVLARDREAALKSSYPGPECLFPHEVHRLCTGGGLEDDRLRHLEKCDACAALLGAATAKEELFEVVLHEVRALTVGGEVNMRKRAQCQGHFEDEFSSAMACSID